MKKFGNTAIKTKAILGVFSDGEKLKGDEITERLVDQGYMAKNRNVQMFIYHYMIHKHLEKETIDGVNHYSPIH